MIKSVWKGTVSLKTSLFAAWVSLISNILLTAIKLIVGSAFRSPALVADGMNNGADILASAVSLGSMKASSQPADQEHPYGHGKIEVIASLIVAIILGLAAVAIIVESIEAILHPVFTFHRITLWVAGLSFVWKWILYFYTIRIGKDVNSKGLIATAYDHLSDMFTSLAVVVGFVIAWVCKEFQIPGGYLADPIAGIIVSLIILWIAYKMGSDAFHILIERNVPHEMLEEYKKVILQIPNVRRIDDIRGREHGHYILVDIRVGVPAELTVKQGHDISKLIKHRLMEQFDEIEEVLVHVNPWYKEDGEGSL